MVRTLINFSVVVIFVATSLAKVGAQSQVAAPTEQFWNNGIGHSTWALGLEPEEQKRMLALWNSIGEDLKTDSNALSGTYVKGGDSGYFLRWSTIGFVVIPYFDQHLITDYGYGKVALVDEWEVVFIPEKELKGGRGLSRMPLRWTAILGHFVPVEMLADFGEYRAGLGEYNEFNGSCCDFVPAFLSARIDRQDKPFPSGVPARHQHFLKNPVTGRITSVRKTRRVRNWGYDGNLYSQWMEKAALTPFTIDVGSREGLKKNMLFRIKGEHEHQRYLQVTEVGRAKSKGYVVQDISFGLREGFYRDYESGQTKRLPPIRVGIQITTSPVID
ncbi:MAG TPA: hypothetical protein VIG25_06565 [Pyrinomonadaceae bacterium]|jgi:hypothetical protein